MSRVSLISGFPRCRLPKGDFAPFQHARQGCKDRNAAGTSLVVARRRLFELAPRARVAFERLSVDHGRTSPVGFAIDRCSRAHALALSHFLLRKFETAINWARKTVQHKPSWFQGHVVLIASLVELRRLDEARVALSDYLAQHSKCFAHRHPEAAVSHTGAPGATGRCPAQSRSSSVGWFDPNVRFGSM